MSHSVLERGKLAEMSCDINDKFRRWRSLGESNPCFSLERAAS
jgi:hypothetical protein